MIWLLIGYMFLFIHRPFEVWPGLGEYRIELLYMLFAGAIWAAVPKRFEFNPLHLAYACFAAAVLFCALASPWAESCWARVDVYFKFLVFYLLLVTSMREEKDLRRLVLGFLAVMAIYQFHSLWEYVNGRHVSRMFINRLIGVDTTFGDPNTFANSVLLSLVFVPAVWASRPTPWARPFLVGYVLLSLLCISRTGSRGAFIGLLILTAMHIWRSKHRWALGAAALAASPVLWMALPDQLQNRFETIINPGVGPANAQLSAEGRIVGLQLGYELLQANPLSGIGPGAWRPATGRQLESHNLYGQVMGEMGALGIATFAGILLAFGWNLWRIRAAYRRHPEWGTDFTGHCTGAIGLAILLLLLTGNFGHNLFRYHWVWYGAFLTIAHGSVARREQEEVEAGAWWPEWQATWQRPWPAAAPAGEGV